MNVTVLNSIKDSRGIVQQWQCTPLNHVHLELVHKGADDNSEGASTLVMIWKTKLGSLSCVPKGNVAPGCFSLDVGEYLIPGIVTEPPEAGEPIRGFIKTHNVLQITSVEECFYGAPAMQHWEVTAK